MKISVVIPCYRSENTIEKVVGEIKAEFLKQSKYDYQIILVNDGSPDNTISAIKRLCANDRKILGINLSRNFGQASAKMAAIKYIEGDIAVYMDDDGQHPASGIFQLAEKICAGYDVVYAAFPHKKHSAFKRFTSWLNKKVSVWVGNSPAGIRSSSFLAYSRFVVDSLKNYQSPFVSMGGYLMKITNKYANVELEHRDRLAGESGYTLKKLLKLWMNTFTNFTIVPLRISSLLGVCSAAIGMLFGFFVIIRKIIRPDISAGYSSTISVILFIGGIIMMMLGMIGEYLGRLYMTVSNAPQYAIREILNYEE